MSSEITYAEVRFKNEFNASGAVSKPPAAPKEKTSPYQRNPGFPKQLLASLLILLLLLAISFFIAFMRKGWGCCPENWIVSNTSCYFISFKFSNWTNSEKNCIGMGAHLLVINTKEEQLLIIQKLNRHSAYYVGLSDPEGMRQWQWVDQSPYNESVVFWHSGEPSNHNERCVIINLVNGNWGWNDIPCAGRQNWICEMMKIFL
ncbi:C-type lectin domain family 4 member A-like isoform X2 [Trichechus manatus latirostris]|uniref:C-type lectin domain family 4 member A-like isoform X2 n=1 Tax=Trichechus manatus latirostris TaxID=127582 RepID=A0A2Y9E517_TRIMA|nr:C-type lectin domain family 4 member A-like isoform X2 [Trichechus manatus latirostris]